MSNHIVARPALSGDTAGRPPWTRMAALLLLVSVNYSLDAADRPAELAVPFAVPAVVTPSENGSCRLAPMFELLQVTPAVVQSFFSESQTQSAEVVTVASSSHDKVERGADIDTPEFWHVTTGPASCLSKCIRLPLGATLTQLTLTYSDGREPCLIKPIDGRLTPTLIGILCQDSAWPEVLVQPGSRTVVCATATNFSGLLRPTLHRLLLRYRSTAQGQ